MDLKYRLSLVILMTSILSILGLSIVYGPGASLGLMSVFLVGVIISVLLMLMGDPHADVKENYIHVKLTILVKDGVDASNLKNMILLNGTNLPCGDIHYSDAVVGKVNNIEANNWPIRRDK